MNTTESATHSESSGQPARLLEAVEVTTGPEPDAAVIWLHGLGADGHDFEPIVPQLSWPGMPDIRYVFPHAPVRPVTVNGGMPMRAWYDVIAIDAERGHDRRGIIDSIDQSTELLKRERARGIASERIVVAGFSQGGAIALQTALRYPEKLAGLIILSSYLLMGDRLESEANASNYGLPVFAGHGSVDPVVPPGMGEAAARKLQSLAYPVEWHVYQMPHAVCPEEIQDIAGWLRQRFG